MTVSLFLKEDENDIPSKIKRKLSSFGISGLRMKEPILGPIVTGYPIEILGNIPISKILNKAEDLALALGVESVDIQRVGGEIIAFVPNEERKIIDFKEALFWYLQDESVREMQIPILLGMDFHGEKAVIDLVIQPHLLIAGSTGSGKSILESSIIASLSMLKSKNELSLILVDTKRLDLTQFANLPNVAEMVRDLQEFYITIDQLIAEVDYRNKLIEQTGVRNIKEYNEVSELKLKYVVMIIDEFGDLLQRDKEFRAMQGRNSGIIPVDLSLARLVQICRASGIHVIACTQRTDVKTVHGGIKANFPTRISLKLPTSADSRTILGEKGAENLLGKGDMLLKAQDSDELKRYHAPFVRLEDIDMILKDREMILETLARPRLES